MPNINKIDVGGTEYDIQGNYSSAAEDVAYDNTVSGLTATDAQAAIDELNSSKQNVLTNPLTQSDVVNNLTSTSITAPLSAAQGKALNDGKQDKLTNPLTQSDVKNNLTSTDTNKPLSAKQGKVLNENIGTLSSLTTTNKTSAVGAINELNSNLVNHYCERVVKTLGSLASFTVTCGFKPKKVTCYGASELATISSIGIGNADKSAMCSFTMNNGSHGSFQGNQGVIGELYYDSSNYRVLQIDSITDTSITFTVSGSGYGGDSRTAIWDLYIE